MGDWTAANFIGLVLSQGALVCLALGTIVDPSAAGANYLQLSSFECAALLMVAISGYHVAMAEDDAAAASDVAATMDALFDPDASVHVDAADDEEIESSSDEDDGEKVEKAATPKAKSPRGNSPSPRRLRSTPKKGTAKKRN